MTSSELQKKIHDHFCSKKFHKDAVEAAAVFAAVMKNPDLAIDHRLSSERSKRAAENHCKLLSIAETIIFCGRQGLAFRGHRDDTSTKEDSSANQGNFLALLHFRVQAGDKVLENCCRECFVHQQDCSKPNDYSVW